MNVVPLTAESGRPLGTSVSRRLRLEGKIPATVYGLGHQTASLTIERSEFRRAMTTQAGANALIELTYDGGSHFTLVKELQRHPVRRDPIHIDFQRIDPEQPMQLSIPITLVGDAKKVTSNGGRTEQILQQLMVSVRPDAIPNDFQVDISDLEIDQHITVADLPLPDGVTTEIDPTALVVTAPLTRAAMDAARAQAAVDAGEEAPAEEL